MRFIAVVGLSILRLTQYFSAAAARSINRAFAVIKILLLIILILAGAKFAVKTNNDCELNTTFPIRDASDQAFQRSGISFVKTLLAVFSFEGWENATFVGSS